MLVSSLKYGWGKAGRGGGGKKWWLDKRKVVVVMYTMVTLGFSTGCFWWVASCHWSNAADELVSMCDERARIIQDQFAVSVNDVHALAILVAIFHYGKQPSVLDQETFANYTAETSFERPLLNGVAYAERVVHQQRKLFEARHGWTIQTMNRVPSPVQDEYAPVIFSQETVSYIRAIDMMSGEDDRENILRARSTGKAVLTKPFRLLSNHLGVVLTFPVYHTRISADATVEQRVGATVGYLGGAFDVESLVENLLKQLAGNHDILVNVYDVTNSSEPLIMYGCENPDGYIPLTHVNMLDFGDPFRKHQMVCRYREKPPMQLAEMGAAIAVFVICILIGEITFAALNRWDTAIENYRKMEELKVKAEAADVAKSQFLATVSHEIRTPMNGVIGMIDMLLETDLNLTQKDYAQTAEGCGRALVSLINEVLDYAKIEAGKLEIEAVPFELRSILDDVISLFSFKSREKRIELAVFVSDKVPEVVIGDPGRFRQIITNLVGNAVKFTEKGHIFVQVHLIEKKDRLRDVNNRIGMNGQSAEIAVECNRKCNTLSVLEAADGRNIWENFKWLLYDAFGNEMVHERDCDNVTLMVSVEDTGVGIPFLAQDRVFAPFMQADSSTSRNYGGTGIGLSISKCLVELMGGKIGFLSKPHVGTTFAFTTVFNHCTESTACEIRKSLSDDALLTNFKGMRTFLVDGRPVRSAVTLYHMKRLGISVEVMSNIKMVLDAISEINGCLKPCDHPHLMLMEMDSWALEMDIRLHNQLLQWKEKNIIKIIVLVTTESDKAKFASYANTVIMKPLKASTVASCLQQVLGIERQQKKVQTICSVSLHKLLVGKNILVVDDNRINLRVAAGALKKYGAKVECAESGEEALKLLKLPHKFDACFMDVQMPEMDGFEVTRQIRLMESNINEHLRNGGMPTENVFVRTEWHLPILAMTADVIQATYEECMKCGMDGHVPKPFKEKQLYEAVVKFFSLQP